MYTSNTLEYMMLMEYLNRFHKDLRYNVRGNLFVWHEGKLHQIKHIRLARNFGYGYYSYELRTTKDEYLYFMSSVYVCTKINVESVYRA